MLLRCLFRIILFLGLLPQTVMASNACIDLFLQDGLLTPYQLQDASDARGGNSILILGGRYSAKEISATNNQLIRELTNKFTSTFYVHGDRNPRPKMPVTVELPQQKLENAKTIEEIRTIINETIRESIFSALNSYDKAQGQPELIVGGNTAKKSTDAHVPRDLYELLHANSLQLWSPNNVVSQFAFVFTNVQKIITALSTPDKANKISPNLRSVLATLIDFMEPAIIPTANRPQFENGAYDNLVDSQARNYTVAMVLSDQQIVMMGYNVKDLGEDTVAQRFRAIVERQGASVKNVIGVRQN